MGGEQKQVAIGASGGALWGEGQTAPGPVGLFLGNFGLKKVAGQGTIGERRQGGKESNGSLFPRGEKGAEFNFK